MVFVNYIRNNVALEGLSYEKRYMHKNKIEYHHFSIQKRLGSVINQ